MSDRLYDALAPLVDDNLRQHLKQKGFDGDFVFPSMKGPGPATDIRKAIQGAAKRAGVTKRETPHMLRHSFAAHLVAKKNDFSTIQELCGHNDVRTTTIYTHFALSQKEKSIKTL